MRRALASSVLVAAVALPAGAVPISGDAAVAPCGGFGGEPAPPFFGGGVQLVLPSPGSVGVPRNAVLRLAQDPDVLEQQGFPPIEIGLEDEHGALVPFTRRGAVLRPHALLDANTTYQLVSEDPFCPDCGPTSWQFTTGSVIDVRAPVVEDVPVAHLFVSPSDQFCPFANHSLFLDLGVLGADVAWIEVAATPPGGTPQRLFGSPAQFVQQVSTSVGQATLALGDEVMVAVTPVDLVGNVGPARIVKTRARPFTDASGGVWNLAPEQCALPGAPAAHIPAVLPANGVLQVDFPFETVPLALEKDGEQIALHPQEETSGGRVLEPARPLEPGASYEIVPLDCVHCVCRGCSLASGVVEVGAADEAAPGAPVISSLDEDLDPERATDSCRPDRTALLVVLEAGEDDVASAMDLRYDAVLRLEDKLPVRVGSRLAPSLRADGTVVLRLETHPYGRLLTERFTLEIEAIDSAGNRSAATALEHEPAGATAGCAASGTPRAASAAFGLSALALGLALALRRRRPQPRAG